MDGIDRISQRIIEDAQAEAAGVIEDAQDRARSLKDRRTIEVEKNNERLHRENSDKAQERKRRMLAVAQLEMRKDILTVKQELIDKAMEEARKAIIHMPREEYRDMIARMLIGSAEGDEEVVFSKADSERLDKGLIEEVNTNLKEQGKKGNLKLSPDRGSFDGGFILRSGGMEINNTFESIIRMSRDELESQVAHILFGEEG